MTSEGPITILQALQQLLPPEAWDTFLSLFAGDEGQALECLRWQNTAMMEVLLQQNTWPADRQAEAELKLEQLRQRDLLMASLRDQLRTGALKMTAVGVTGERKELDPAVAGEADFWVKDNEVRYRGNRFGSVSISKAPRGQVAKAAELEMLAAFIREQNDAKASVVDERARRKFGDLASPSNMRKAREFIGRGRGRPSRKSAGKAKPEK